MLSASDFVVLRTLICHTNERQGIPSQRGKMSAKTGSKVTVQLFHDGSTKVKRILLRPQLCVLGSLAARPCTAPPGSLFGTHCHFRPCLCFSTTEHVIRNKSECGRDIVPKRPGSTRPCVASWRPEGLPPSRKPTQKTAMSNSHGKWPRSISRALQLHLGRRCVLGIVLPPGIVQKCCDCLYRTVSGTSWPPLSLFFRPPRAQRAAV